MTVKQLLEDNGFESLALPCPEREIKGAYIGDLLSWVMSRAQADNVWITIMSNINVIAVASLTDVSCVILAEGVTLDDDVITAANDKSVNILKSKLSAFEIASKLCGKI